jgi:tetratricopeptide (TPR) repeat protein
MQSLFSPISILYPPSFIICLSQALIPKLVIATRCLIFDILSVLRAGFSPHNPPPDYDAILDLCQKAAFTIQDNQALQFTGNQYFNCGNAFYKIGKRREAREALEKSLELDFSPLPSTQNVPNQSEEEKKKLVLFRCRKLEMLGECCQRGQEIVCNLWCDADGRMRLPWYRRL